MRDVAADEDVEVGEATTTNGEVCVLDMLLWRHACSTLLLSPSLSHTEQELRSLHGFGD